MRRLALVALLVLAGCGTFGLQAHPISLAFKAGDTYKYTFHATLKYTVAAQGFSVPFNLELNGKDTVTVKSVDSSGTADVTLELTDLVTKTTVNGETTSAVSKSQTVTLKIGPDGRIVSVNGSALAGGAMPDFTGMGSGLISAVLPDGSVKVGDTWTKDYDAKSPIGTGSVHVTTASKYLRDEKVGGVNTAVVQSKITTTLDLALDRSSLGVPMLPAGGASTDLQSMTIKGTITSDVTSWVDFDGHRLVKTHSTGSTDATLTINTTTPSTSPGFSGPVTFKGTQSVELDPA